MLVEEGTIVYAVVKTTEQKNILNFAFCSQWGLHCLKEKVKELNKIENEIYSKKWFVTKQAKAVKQVGVIALEKNIEKLKGIQFFDIKKLAEEKKEIFIKNNKEAEVIEVQLYENVPKNKQIKTA